jgi:Ca2+-binding EF-hand superfamily protein/mono/diheme cytochrome c family protein
MPGIPARCLATVSFGLLASIPLGPLSLSADDAVFQRHDRNGDGKITAEELGMPVLFRRFDLDGDGVVTLEEYRRVAAGAKRAEPGGKGAGSGTGAFAKLEAAFVGADKDGDGRVSREEAGAFPWFDRLDQDRDGYISREELLAVKEIVTRGALRGLVTSLPDISDEEVAEATSGPELLKPESVGVGRQVPDLAFDSLPGESLRLSGCMGEKGLVVAMTSATCPLSKRYLPSLVALEAELREAGLGLVLVNPFASETREQIEAQLSGHKLAAPYAHDADRALAAALGAATTTEVFLLDASRTLVYRGALDDQYGIDYSLDAPRHRYLAAAVEAIAKGVRPGIEATAAPGCELDLPEPDSAGKATDLTYHRDISRILRQNCVDCHRDGGIAPFALDGYEEVTDRVRVIRRVVLEGTMPPWFAATSEGAGEGSGSGSPWANDCSLSERDKADLLAWIDSKDRPLGDPADAPLPRAYSTEWSIGEPDLVIPISRAYEIKATGFMPYQFDVVETALSEDRWVSGYEILPSARDVVHHVIVQVHEPGAEVRNVGEGAEGYWAAYVPGNGSRVYPEGFARRLPAGAKVSFQIHYTPSGEAKSERLRLGLLFAKEPPRYEVRTVSVANPRLSIPPGEADHVETRSQAVPYDIPVMALMAHMHVRGKAFRFEVAHPDGRQETLLDIPRYDFNWQLRYDYKEPKRIPRGSTVKITAVYDNSPGNRANPDPTKTVKWGSQTVDEMMIGYFEYFVPFSSRETASVTPAAR